MLVRPPSTANCCRSGVLKQWVKALSRHVQLLHYLCLVQAAIHPLLVLWQGISGRCRSLLLVLLLLGVAWLHAIAWRWRLDRLMVWGIVAISIQMIALQIQLILCAKGRLFVLVERRQGEIACRDASIVVLDAWHVHSIIACIALMVACHFLHKVSRGELKGVSVSISYCHRHELVFFDFNI